MILSFMQGHQVQENQNFCIPFLVTFSVNPDMKILSSLTCLFKRDKLTLVFSWGNENENVGLHCNEPT